jgi:AcrR family transcriptional regulator
VPAGTDAPLRQPPTAPREDDRETRRRSLDEARDLFAAHGFRNVTVRQICLAARANGAAVNYHFGDKLGLYRELLDEAAAIMQQTTAAAQSSGEGGTAEQKLRAYIRVFMQRVCQGHDSWIHQLMTREMAEPTAALDIVIREVIVPRIAYVSELVAEMLGVATDDPRVLRCVLSVQSQFHAAMANPVSRRLVPGLTADAAAVDTLARHIADFSIGGIRSLRER